MERIQVWQWLFLLMEERRGNQISSVPYYALRMRWGKDGVVGYNHQMPSVIRLNDNKELVVAVETNNSGYHISLCYSDKNEWGDLAADQAGPEDSNNCAFLYY